ncbi:carbohydrate ABC transporter permease [Glycomyces harbinensis]|uniref:Multiple sugar transport system permease protein n=1 Tax=Glycomyces harbinensis TaxID=58114 RepID=A0A1G6RM77_9ACTN|nr:sugar ABC transporter permease [Glycomyces harbinensis]SDD05513.1 multiple sugar transport system permease protein [Glycomyces harbinensis]
MAVSAPAADTERAGTGDQRPRPRRSGRLRTSLAFWAFVGPFLAGLMVFTLVPVVWSAYLSLFDATNTVTPLPEDFVGFGNYADMLTDRAFQDSLITFSVFAAFIVPLTFACSLGLALMLNQLRFMRAFFRSVFFLPFACSYVVASLVWKMSIFSGVRYGLMNSILDLFGIEDVAWLFSPDPPWYWLVIVSLRLWIQCGFYMILFIAALQQIPQHLYEAAYVDGAKPGRQTFWHITLPQLRATAVAVLMLILIAAYQAFDEFVNLIGNQAYARPPLAYLYYTALGTQQDLGRGSAGALILALLIAIVTLLQGRFLGFGNKEGR